MATSAADICNRALLRVGQRETIETLDDGSTAAASLKAIYDDTRDIVLVAHPWPFATVREALTEVTLSTGETPVQGRTYVDARAGWEYAYQLPAECVHAQYLWTGIRNPTSTQRVAFTTEYDQTYGRVLLTDMEDAVLVYTLRVEDVRRYPSTFVDALAWALAADLAMAQPKKQDLARYCENQYRFALARAAASTANEAQPDQPHDSELIRERG